MFWVFFYIFASRKKTFKPGSVFSIRKPVSRSGSAGKKCESEKQVSPSPSEQAVLLVFVKISNEFIGKNKTQN
jgi:hypothetical protein